MIGQKQRCQQFKGFVLLANSILETGSMALKTWLIIVAAITALISLRYGQLTVFWSQMDLSNEPIIVPRRETSSLYSYIEPETLS
jgi:hypothetical protein